VRCYKARRLFSPYIDGVLTKAEMEQVESHLKMCKACSAYFEEMLSVHNEFAHLTRFVAPSGFATRVMANIEAKDNERLPIFNMLTMFIKVALIVLTIIVGTRLGSMLGTSLAMQKSNIEEALSLDTLKAVQPHSIGAAYLAMVEGGNEK